jgi:hypothetical protein
MSAKKRPSDDVRLAAAGMLDTLSEQTWTLARLLCSDVELEPHLVVRLFAEAERSQRKLDALEASLPDS